MSHEPNPSAGKVLLHTLEVAGILAVVGYLWGLVQGAGNEHVLALCFGAVGGVAILLGYGPIAHIIRPFGALAGYFHKSRTRSDDAGSRTEDRAE
ncbi:MAG TPA: hypothetical protein VEI07_01895 [Planctomycetaceae bacterium]|nr:hypothetical protein [Planctomycetaceae bacterium]